MKTIPVEKIREELAAMGANLRSASLESPLRRIVPVVRDGFAGNFADATGSLGAAWPPRKKIGDGHPLLMDTLALYGATQGGLGGVLEVNPRSVGMGIDKGVQEGGIPGAAAHNWGYPPNNLPQREFLYASEDTLDRSAEVLAEAAYSVLFVF